MRFVSLIIIAISVCSCTQQADTDPFDTNIAFVGSDTIQVDWRAIGPIDPVSQERFVWSCGTYIRTPRENAALDSIEAVIRSQGGVICF